MASPTTPNRADVPLHGGYTRFELELEVRPAAYVTAPILFVSLHVNTALVCTVPRESRLSQLPGHAKVL
jgi:hypothetical protein